MFDNVQYEFDSEYDLCFKSSVLFDSNHDDDFVIIDEKSILNENKKSDDIKDISTYFL